MAVTRDARPQPGIGVDAAGGQVVDPTENVKALMEASIKALTDQSELRAQLADEKILRMERELAQVDRLIILRAEHAKETRGYDNDRWDKIRTIDMANASATAAQLLAAVNNYAAAQERMAQTLRDQVAATADAANKNLSALINPIVDRLAILERASYTVAGRSAVTDPAMTELVAEMRKLVIGRADDRGKAAGLSLSAALFMGVLSVIATLIGIGGAIAAFIAP